MDMNLTKEKLLSVLGSSTSKTVYGFLIILVGIWVPSYLFGLRSWTPIPAIITGVFTVALGTFVIVRSFIELNWKRGHY